MSQNPHLAFRRPDPPEFKRPQNALPFCWQYLSHLEFWHLIKHKKTEFQELKDQVYKDAYAKLTEKHGFAFVESDSVYSFPIANRVKVCKSHLKYLRGDMAETITYIQEKLPEEALDEHYYFNKSSPSNLADLTERMIPRADGAKENFETLRDVLSAYKVRVDFVDEVLELGKKSLKQAFNEAEHPLAIALKQRKQIADDTRVNRRDKRHRVDNLVMSLIEMPSFFTFHKGKIITNGNFFVKNKTNFSNLFNATKLIPEDILMLLRDRHSKIRFGEWPKDANPERRELKSENVKTKSRKPGSYDETRTQLEHKSAYAAGKIIYISEKYIDSRTGNEMRTKIDEKLLRHEIAHTIDTFNPGEASRFSEEKGFKEAYMRDFANFNNRTKYDFNYQIQLDDNTEMPTDSGYHEAFAEILADIWGDGRREGAVTRAFPEAAKWVRENVTVEKILSA